MYVWTTLGAGTGEGIGVMMGVGVNLGALEGTGGVGSGSGSAAGGLTEDWKIVASSRRAASDVVSSGWSWFLQRFNQISGFSSTSINGRSLWHWGVSWKPTEGNVCQEERGTMVVKMLEM